MREEDGRSQRERMLAGDLYIADDPELAADLLRARRLQDRFNGTAADEAEERRRIMEELLGAFGEGSEIRPPFYCDYGYQTRVGARVFANFGLVALDGPPSRSATTSRSAPTCSCSRPPILSRPICVGPSGRRPSRSPSGPMPGWAGA